MKFFDEVIQTHVSPLNRAAHLRRDPVAVRRMFERGKHLILSGDGVFCYAEESVRIKHLSCADVAKIGSETVLFADSVFLGLVDDVPYFAHWFDHKIPSGRFVDMRSAFADLTVAELTLTSAAQGVMNWHNTHQFCASCGAPSMIADAGWRRHCHGCGVDHFPRTDPVVIMLVVRNDQLLIARNQGWPEKLYSILAGFMEPGENVADAVRREVFEEAGVRVGPVQMIDSQPWTFPSSLMLGCLARADSDEIKVDQEELVDARWVSRDALATILAGDNPEIEPPKIHAIAGILMRKWLADT